LPEHLRPPRDLDHESLDARTLTTYAGLLFRDLLDRFDGDAGTAVGAYNGGPRNPNPRYEAGVRRVAEYARRMLEQAAAMPARRGEGPP
jgi:soluble lytic murein transglycosylase-like protein